MRSAMEVSSNVSTCRSNARDPAFLQLLKSGCGRLLWRFKGSPAVKVGEHGCHNPGLLGTKVVERGSQDALGLDALFARCVDPQEGHHDVANEGQVIGGVAALYP